MKINGEYRFDVSPECFDLERILKADPTMAKRIFDAYKITVQVNSRNTYDSLQGIVKINPTFAEQALDVIKIGMQQGKEDGRSLEEGYDVLDRIIIVNPKLTQQVFDVIKMGMRLGKDNWNSLYHGYIVLGRIVKTDPTLMEEVFDFMKQNIQSKKNINSMTSACTALGGIAAENPEFAQQVLDIIKVGMQHAKKTSLDSYRILTTVVEKYPTLAKQTLSVAKTAMQFSRDSSSLDVAYRALGNIARIVRADPTLIEQVADIVQMGMQSDKNDANSLHSAYNILDYITKANPKNKRIVDLLSAKSILLDRVSKERRKSYENRWGLKGKALEKDLHDTEQKKRLSVSKNILKKRQKGK